MGSSKLKAAGLVLTGVALGVALSLNIPALAQKYSAIVQRADFPLPVDELKLFSEVYGRIKSDYVEPVDDKRLMKEAINGMITGLDPHSAFLDQDAFKDLSVSTQGEFGGLGIEVAMEDGFVKVVAPMDDTPAARAGIKAGDYIVKIDDQNVKGISINEAVKRMRGKPNTPIKLTIYRKSESKPMDFSLARAVIKVKSVRTKMIEPGFASVRISQFQEHTGEYLTQALQDLYKQNPDGLRGMVLDLRTNPGGLLNSAVAVSAAFLPKDALVVYTDGRTDDAKMKLTASKENYLRGAFRDDYIGKIPAAVKTVPIVVLVNEASASAAEIVAGALQDHKRATVLGTQTFGKGSVQTILPLGNQTAIKLTTARYYTPNGRSIQAKGISPDLVVEDGNKAKSGLILREADLERHLSNDQQKDEPAKAAPAPKSEIKSETKPEPSRKGADEPTANEKDANGEKPDIQMQQAINVLKGLGVTVTQKTTASR